MVLYNAMSSAKRLILLLLENYYVNNIARLQRGEGRARILVGRQTKHKI